MKVQRPNAYNEATRIRFSTFQDVFKSKMCCCSIQVVKRMFMSSWEEKRSYFSQPTSEYVIKDFNIQVK